MKKIIWLIVGLFAAFVAWNFIKKRQAQQQLSAPTANANTAGQIAGLYDGWRNVAERGSTASQVVPLITTSVQAAQGLLGSLSRYFTTGSSPALTTDPYTWNPPDWKANGGLSYDNSGGFSSGGGYFDFFNPPGGYKPADTIFGNVSMSL